MAEKSALNDYASHSAHHPIRPPPEVKVLQPVSGSHTPTYSVYSVNSGQNPGTSWRVMRCAFAAKVYKIFDGGRGEVLWKYASALNS